MFVVKKSDFSRDFNSTELLAKKQKEVKTWQWLILIGCFLFQMLPYCVALNLTSALLPADWALWTHGNQTIMSVTFTVGAVAAAFAGPFIAKIFSKQINMRLVYGLGVILAMIGFFGSGINAMIPDESRTLPVVAVILYISNIISQIGVMIFSGLGVNNLISKWWPAEKRGFALGIAFAGGSLGNIWMQQLLGFLKEQFGNSNENPIQGGDRWATYLILAGMGLVTGLLIVLFVCRKPVPPTEIFDIDAKGLKSDNYGETKNIRNNLAVSPLETRKYAPYWILGVGYLILQMGTVHASINGQFISYATELGTGQASSVIALGGTLFGVSCLVGNFGGGVLNDKIGPNKSILIAGIGQVAAIFCLMYSVKVKSLAYVYFILAGLSVYIYTSTPSYLCGRLYGPSQSNNHMSILGIFVALGFAIVNSITGVLTGDIGIDTKTGNIFNPHTMFGEVTSGNLELLGIFAMVCMGVGTLIVVICSTIIMNKGIKGLLDHTSSKYSRIIAMKHNLNIKLSARKIFIKGKDFRANNEKRDDKIREKLSHDRNYNTDLIYGYALDAALRGKVRINREQKNVLKSVLFNKVVSLEWLTQINNNSETLQANIDDLLKRKMLVSSKLGNIGTLYEIGPKLKIKDIEINNDIFTANNKINDSLEKIKTKFNNKIEKINVKLQKANAIEIDQDEQLKINKKSDKYLVEINKHKEKVFRKSEKLNDWKAYKNEYSVLESLYYCEQMKNALELRKEQKIKAVQKKLFVSNFVMNFNLKQEVKGHNLLVDYYNNVYRHCDKLIDKKLDYIFEEKENKIEIKKLKCQSKINKQLKNKEKVFA